MREATTFSLILEMKLRFEIGQTLLRSAVDREGFWEETGAAGSDKSLFEWRWKKFLQKERVFDKICDDWTKLVEAEFQK